MSGVDGVALVWRKCCGLRVLCDVCLLCSCVR